MTTTFTGKHSQLRECRADAQLFLLEWLYDLLHNLLELVRNGLHRSRAVLFPMFSRDLVGCHPCSQDGVPVRKVRLGEVLLDSELLVVDVVVGDVVSE